MAKSAVLIPAFNEELVIQNTIQSVLAAGFDPNDVFVVDDRSTDKTADLAKETGVHVFIMEENSGKAGALNGVIAHCDICNKYDYAIFLDADSVLTPDFKTRVDQHTREYPDAALFVGQVKSHKGNYLTSYRAMEYAFAHDFYKDGQSNFNLVYVSPGCASIYAASALRNLHLSGDTLAEDMDLTLQVHRMGGVIKYTPDVVVYTQDPNTLKDYIKQITRWYRGGCQVMKKHGTLDPTRKKQWVDLYMMLLVLEAVLFNRIVFGAGILAFWGSQILLFVVAVDVAILFIVATYGAYRTKRLDILYRFPQYFWLPYIASVIFIKSIFEVFVLNQTKFSWNKVSRY